MGDLPVYQFTYRPTTTWTLPSAPSGTVFNVQNREWEWFDMPTNMTRQHFEAIAQAVAGIEGINIRRIVCNALIPALRGFNASFDSNRFRIACMAEEEPNNVFVGPSDEAPRPTPGFRMGALRQVIDNESGRRYRTSREGRYQTRQAFNGTPQQWLDIPISEVPAAALALLEGVTPPALTNYGGE